ncbi:MAG: hypothetical protein ACRDWN_09685, partial [Acidimicrobiales bacterium]
LALLLVGVALALAVALHSMDVPERVRRSSRLLVVVLAGQAAVGYVQYFTHLPAVVVEVHELGAAVLVIAVLELFLSLTHHRAEAGVPAATGRAAWPVRAARAGRAGELAGAGAGDLAGAGVGELAGAGAGAGELAGAGAGDPETTW